MQWRWRLFSILLLTHSLPLLLLWTIAGEWQAFNNQWWALAGALGLALGFSYLIYKQLTKPLLEINRHLQNAAEGNFADRSDVNLPGIFGTMAHALNTVSGKLQEFVNRTQAETDVIVSEANRLRMILNSIKDGVFALDRDKHVILFNKAASSITGLSINDVAGRHLNDVLPLLHHKQLAVSEWIDVCEGNDIQQKSWENIAYTTDSGEALSLEVEALYTGADPNGVRTLVTFHNRTEEQQIEDMKVDFVALAAHELRTPVTIIKGYLEILEEEVGPQLTPEYREFIRKIDISANQLSGSINNILHVSHIEHGELNLQPETADWREIVITACEELAKKATAQGKQLYTSIPDDLPPVSVDRVSITEVITNLVNNAIKYSQRGKSITVNVASDGQSITTEVIDQGVGIPPNAIGKLFTKFYRSHRTRTSHRGTGLGLFMSKAVIEAHGGRIWVESQEGEGSTFGFELPAVANSEDGSDNSNVTRGVHGWIKNHSLYRG